MKIFRADEFDPLADVLAFTITGIEEHSAFFHGPMYWLICGYTREGIANVEILDAVYRVFGERLPSEARVDRRKCSDGSTQWQFAFFDEPVHSEVEDHSEDGLWRATSSWNDRGLLVSLILTCCAKHGEEIVTVMPR